MFTNQNIQHFFTEYEDILLEGLNYNHSEKEIYDVIYKKEFNNYLRKGVNPRLDELTHVINFVRKYRSGELSYNTKNESNTYYKWQAESDSCERCKELDGQIFDYEPERPHPNCRCEIVEVSKEEAGKIYEEHKEKIEERDNINQISINNAKIYNELDGKFYDKYGNQVKGSECASYVANAFRTNGIAIDKPPVREGNKLPSACDYGPSFEKVGFENIKTGQGEIPKSYKPQKGDIVIFNESDKHPDGHIQMYNGEYWISDYKQNTSGGIERGGNGFFPSQSYKDENGFTIYRNLDWVDWEIDRGSF